MTNKLGVILFHSMTVCVYIAHIYSSRVHFLTLLSVYYVAIIVQTRSRVLNYSNHIKNYRNMCKYDDVSIIHFLDVSAILTIDNQPTIIFRNINEGIHKNIVGLILTLNPA